jgi:hypothetical protein
MSTEILNYNREDLIDFIREEPLDMLDEFSDDEIADFVIETATKLGTKKGREVANYLTSAGGCKNYQFKVSNHYNGFVSCADEEGDTGVSRTAYYPFYSDEEGALAGLETLAGMINEAWYICNN